MKKINVCILGATGRMGKSLIQLIFDSDEFKLISAYHKPSSQFIGYDVSEFVGLPKTGVLISDELEKCIDLSDIVIDFSFPSTSISAALYAAESAKPFVLGTTGFNSQETNQLKSISKLLPILHSGNMGFGINIITTLCEYASNLLDSSWDIEILEMHHKFKKDAPSGTAIMLGNSVAKGRGVNIDNVSRYSRINSISPRVEGEIGFSVLRGGGVVGDHTVIFTNMDERIEISHKAFNRDLIWTKFYPQIYALDIRILK